MWSPVALHSMDASRVQGVVAVLSTVQNAVALQDASAVTDAIECATLKGSFYRESSGQYVIKWTS